MNAEELITTVIEGAAIGYAIGLTAAVYSVLKQQHKNPNQ